MEPSPPKTQPSLFATRRRGAAHGRFASVTFLFRSKRPVLLPLFVLGFFAVIAVLLVLFRPKPEVVDQMRTGIPVVEAFKVEPRAVQLTVKTQGTVAPRTETLLSPEVSGHILELSLNFQSGGFFEKGEVLVRLDASDYEAAVADATAALARAQLVLAEEEARVTQALEDWKELGWSQESPSDLVLRKPQLAEALANVDATRAALDLAKRNVERTQIKAPYSGRVREKMVDVGQSVDRSTVLANIYAVDYAEILLPISNQEVGLLNVPLQYRGESESADKPRVVLKAYFGGQTYRWEGLVDRTEAAIDTRSRLMYLIAQVPDPYGRGGEYDRPPLHVGLFVEAEIEGKVVSAAFEIPRTALVDKDTVLIIGPHDRLSSRRVKVVRTDRHRAVITEGLEAGERLCISPLEFFIEGMPVLVSHSEKKDSEPPSDNSKS